MFSCIQNYYIWYKTWRNIIFIIYRKIVVSILEHPRLYSLLYRSVLRRRLSLKSSWYSFIFSEHIVMLVKVFLLSYLIQHISGIQITEYVAMAFWISCSSAKKLKLHPDSYKFIIQTRRPIGKIQTGLAYLDIDTYWCLRHGFESYRNYIYF